MGCPKLGFFGLVCKLWYLFSTLYFFHNLTLHASPFSVPALLWLLGVPRHYHAHPSPTTGKHHEQDTSCFCHSEYSPTSLPARVISWGTDPLGVIRSIFGLPRLYVMLGYMLNIVLVPFEYKPSSHPVLYL